MKKPISWTYFVGLFLFVVGLRIGMGLPDQDLKIFFLRHRSLLTHGFLLPSLLFVAVQKFPDHTARLFAIGVALASTIHLCFDLFPRAWHGLALITIPLYGRTSALFSWLWIALSCVVCLYLALLLIKSIFEIVMSAAALVMTFSAHSGGEQNANLSLWALGVMVAIALVLPSRAGAMVRQLSFKQR